MALDIVGLIIEPVVNYIVKPIRRQLDYLISYRINIQNLKDEKEKLEQLRADVARSKEEEKGNLRSAGNVLEGWLKNTDDILKNTRTILPSEAEIEKGCLSQGLISRYVVSRNAKKTVNTVIQQQKDGREYAKLYYSAPPDKACIVSKKDSDEDDGMSRQLIMEDIIKALNDEETNMIGICGPGGVGKTRMEKKVIAKVEGENLFDKVVFTVVSQQFNLEKLQASIAKQLGLKLDEEDKNIRAVRLNTRLKNEYKILLILDDVWEKLDLEEIGIPLGEEHKGCKVMLTSRNHDICSSMFRTGGKIFTIESLTEGESWDLFRRNTGDRTDDSALYQTAKQICNECGGLPLPILTVANALKDKDQKIWEGALTQLKSVLPENIMELGKVYKSLKLSYDHLDNDEARKLYLHCCLFPDDYSIPLETLARRGMSLGIFAHINSLQEARIRVELLVDRLKSCFLLQKDKDDSSVIMHDALRDLAIYITSREQHSFGINHYLKVNQWPKDIHHEEVTCISVRSRTAVKHPKTLNCPRLEFLEIEMEAEGLEAEGISYLHDDIFHGTRALKTIEVSRMRFLLMPSSIGLLKNLRMLRLFGCEMEDISLIGELVNLEILSMRYSQFRVVPAELGKLEKLRLLDLKSCYTVERIEPGVLSSFLELEELDMEGCRAVEWEGENKVEQSKVKNVSLAELQVMQNLTTLRIVISDRVIPKDTSLPGGLKGFFIRIVSSDNSERSNFLRFADFYHQIVWCSSNAEHVVNWISNIVVDAEQVVLENSVTSRVIDLLARKSFQHVRCLDVSNCKELECVANMSNLIYSCEAPSQYNCFANLERLSISKCEEIVYFLSMPLVTTTLPLLKSLEIHSCKKLEQVFLLEEDNLSGGHGISQIDKVKFPRLEGIVLENLEALKGFCNGTHNIKLPSLRSLVVANLPNIRGFFSNSDSLTAELNQSASMHFLFREKDALASLKNLQLRYMDDAMLLCYQLVSHCCFRGLEDLRIWRCKNLPPYLFIDPVNDARIISAEEEEKEYGENVTANSLFPHLKELELYGLPDLRHVVSPIMQKVPFANVKSVDVECCERLLQFSSLSVARIFSQHVETLSFRDCKEMEQVFVLEENEVDGADQSQIPDIQFPRLRRLTLGGSQALTSFCKGVNNIEFPSLRELVIFDLNNINGFVIPTYGEQSNGMNFLFGTKVSFGGLKDLVLCRLDSELWFHQLCSRTPSFRELEHLTISECHKIRNLFSSSSIGALVNLKKLGIERCSQIEAVIVDDEEGEGMSMKLQFPKLEYLWLINLWKLGSFSRSKHALQLPSLEKLEVRDCGKMQTFAQGYKNVSCLDSELWFHQLCSRTPSFGELEKLSIYRCHKIRNLFSSSSIGALVNLKELVIDTCSQIEAVIVDDEEGEGMSMNLQFLKLKVLELGFLPKLGSFSQSKHALQLPSLEKLRIRYCGEMQTFAQGYINTPRLPYFQIHGESFPVNDINNSLRHQFEKKVSFGGLKDLALSGLDSELWFHQLCSRTPSFRELEVLRISNCNKIRNLFSSSSIGALVNLKELEIAWCSQIEAVIVDDEEGEGMSMKLQFLKLKVLELMDLPKLGSFSQSKHALQLPSLEKLRIRYCGEMQTFAQGYINTPRLPYFQINGESFPVNDINNSLRHQFEKKHAKQKEEVSEIIVTEEEEEDVPQEIHANDEEMEEVAADQITVEVEEDEKKEIMEEAEEQITTDHGSNFIFNDKN